MTEQNSKIMAYVIAFDERFDVYFTLTGDRSLPSMMVYTLNKKRKKIIDNVTNHNAILQNYNRRTSRND